MNTQRSIWMLGLAVGTLSTACLAQYKVVASDGSVTYTDRPPVSTSSRVTPLRAGSTPVVELSSNPALPLELRQVSARYPVTLYTATDCIPCDAARQLLQQRGVPYGERRIMFEEDAVALERLVSWRTVPSVTIGAQALRGFAAAEWTAYIDAAGYPRESRLPRGWTAAVATPLTERAAAPAPAEPAVAAEAPATAPAPSSDNPNPPTSIRF